ncbi:hypothetical protein BO224_04015 [Erysipelotrichaceae bacterium NYU-BL-E8]|uniref:Uncharacterized protein n=1 Tax=Ileibacterium valens TaxID=1862668 RepID=A0A1U7ND44_9FIRM|nr:hypothetical protein BO222_11935 [Ileibacterium valens]OLU38994.1 hypothetical protein BM735_08255 [Erysipelotrichaceae bacterium NYU-BL-F16]OLU41241.1 hypothetical protein BO224_04015 [Erysipelotrichaceae bacterium NYU-BL-E8]
MFSDNFQKIWLRSLQGEYSGLRCTHKPMRKRSNRKRYLKRVRDGGIRMMAILQMDFQGRNELLISKVL